MTVHRYIPNSSSEVKKELLDGIGINDPEELFAAIPDGLRYRGQLDLPYASSEYEVKRRIEGMLSKNTTSNDALSFLGAGCWPHHVPAVCDEINSRSEFLTAYTGDSYSDLGRFQALFEFQSMIGELVAMDAVTIPTYDWANACGDAIRMAALVTGRREILAAGTTSPSKRSVMRSYCGSIAEMQSVEYDSTSGQINLETLKRKISPKTAAVYIENPTYLGFIETEVNEIAGIAHDNGSLLIVGVEPLSLGVLRPPGEYGADIVCGEGQPLGLHTNFGGSSLGFLACRDDPRFLSATGHRLITIAETQRKGELGFTYALPERSMYATREKAASITGTGAALCAITAAVYLSLLGPEGLREVATTIAGNTRYAIRRLSEIRGLKVPLFKSPHFEEFTIQFDGRQNIQTVNQTLLERYRIQGGKELSNDFPELRNTALYCVTEIHSRSDVDRLAASLEEIVK
jgi:glycine dehydrogenase subunit 1